MTRSWVIGWVALVPLLLGAGPPVVKTAAPAPDLDALFDRTDGWIGGDGAFSVAVSPKRTLWLFSDTWVGKIRDGRRTDATIVNNTVGVQEGSGGRLSYTIAQGKDGKPMALIVPSDGRGWFWLQAGVAHDYSVTPFGSRYLAVYTEGGLSPRIIGRLADHPWGPWSEPTVLYECPEMGRDKKVFSYGAKAHPALSSGQDLVVSYVVNAFGFWQVAREAKLYWPRFVRVTLAPSK